MCPTPRDAAADATGPGGPTAPLGRAHRGAFLPTVIVLALYLLGAVVLTWDAWSAGPASHMQAGGDQFTTAWFLRWLPFAVAHGHNPLYTDFGNYPFGVNLLNNTAVPLLGAGVSPMTLLFGPIAAFNTLTTLALFGSATAGYCLARHWTEWRPAAFAGGLLYGFSPYQVAQSNGGHLNLTFVVLPPLILLALDRVVMGRPESSRAAGILLGLLVTAQFFVSTEILVSTVIVGAACLAAAAVVGRRRVRDHLHRALVGGGWALGVAAVLLAYPVWFALRGPAHINGPIQLVPEAYRADLLGPVVPNTFTWLAPADLVRVANGFADSAVENGSYLGITLLATLAVGTLLLWRRHPALRVATIGGVVAFVLSLGGSLAVHRRPGAYLTGLPLPERVFTKVPLLSNTVPARYALYVALFAALVLAIILDRLHAFARRRADRPDALAWAVPGLVAAVCLVPLLPKGPIAGVAAVSTPSYFTSPTLAARPAGRVTVLYPYPSTATPVGQLWQAQSGLHFRSPGGYFLVPDGPGQRIGFSAEVGYGADTLTARVLIALRDGRPPPRTATLRGALLAQWASWHVSSLVAVLDGDAHPAASRSYLTWLAGTPPARIGGVDVWEPFPPVAVPAR